MRYLVDSDFIVDALNGVLAVERLLLGLWSHGLAVSVISLAEVYEGAYGSPTPDEHLERAHRFVSGYVVLEVTEAIARIFAHRRAMLRRQGNLIPDTDLLIAATALHHNLTLLTRNVRHFERVPGLQLYSPQ